VVLKPSEISKNTEKVLVEVLPRYLDQVSRAVVWGRRGQAGIGSPPGLERPGCGRVCVPTSGFCGLGQITAPQPQFPSEE
jgi:hypothetical protein